MKRVVVLLLALLSPLALARVAFELHPISASAFRGFDQLQSRCQGNASSSFWCEHLEDELTLITTKGNDYVFSPAGELLALFTKPQKGQNNRSSDGTYRLALDNNQNLIPVGAAFPGGAVLLDGVYAAPEGVTGGWERLEDADGPYYQGTFRYERGGLELAKTLRVSNITHVLGTALSASPAVGSSATSSEPLPGAETEAAPQAETAGGEGAAETLQYAFPGIAREATPVIKVGQGESFSLNPISQPVPNPSYISVQNNNRNTANAIVLRPRAGELSALPLPPGAIALQAPLGEGGTEFALESYLGPNELVRFQQEGFLDLPGLFRPNLLGQLSLGVLWVLQQIHAFVPNWGLSIIVLTLLFRVLIWPLISTQTRSMYGMQQLQPKLQALQKKHKDDREKLTQESMKLYREAGVNPAGGCLPILLQMPLFLILWRIFSNFEFNSGFLWIPDLGQPDPFFILPILYVIVILAQSYFMAQGNPQMMRQQMILNVVFVFLFLNFPAGVILYYVVSMLVQVFQYWLIKRTQPAPAKAA